MIAILGAAASANPPPPEKLDLSCIAASFPPATIAVRTHSLSGAESGTDIGDGGNDMYDHGNQIRLRTHGQWSQPLKYTQVCAGQAAEPAGPYAHYATCQTPTAAPVFLASFYSASAAIDGFRTSGGTGADGGGGQFANAGTQPLVSVNVTNGHVYGYFKKTFGTTDPSINHLVIARSASAQNTIGSTTDSDLHEVSLAHGVHELYYLMWGGLAGYSFKESDFQLALEIATKCLPRMEALPASPPPPAQAAGACAKPCGDGICHRFKQTPCAAVTQALPQCDCSGCCVPGPFTPVIETPPPPSPVRSPPPPAACSAPCLGTTCGAFAGTTCSAFTSRLGCDCTGCCDGELGNLRCVTDKWPSGLPHLFAFTEGETGRSITDGAADLFDVGNYLSARIGKEWQLELPYTQDCDGHFPTPLLGGKAAYSTCKLADGSYTADRVGDQTAGTLFAAVVTSPESDISGFLVSGNLGADGGGHQDYLTLAGPRGVQGFFKRVYGAQNDASVNHLILARAPDARHMRSTTTNSDGHEALFPTGQPVVYYLLWAGKTTSIVPGSSLGQTGYKYSEEQVQRLVDAVATSCFDEAVGFPPMPPPPASLGPAPASCSTKCGSTTCLAFRTTLCSTISQPPWSCGCGDCCAQAAPPPPPLPPPSPPSPPTAPSPQAPAQCAKPCAGSTCGAFAPYACTDFITKLGCECSGCCETPLDLSCVAKVWPAQLPSLYAFGEGLTGSMIRDGGTDMFDYGNEVRVRIGKHWSSPLLYTQVCDGSFGASVQALGDARYSTCKHVNLLLPGFGAVFAAAIQSPSASITGVLVNGYLGADGQGTQYANNGTDGTYLRGAHGTVGYYKQTFGAGTDSSVNHLIFAPGAAAVGATTKVGATTDSDMHEVAFPRGVTLVYFLMWGGLHGYQYEKEAFQTVLDAVAGACLPESGFVPPAAGGGGGGGGGTAGDGNAGSAFGTVVLVLFLLCLVGVLGFGWYKGWRYPRLMAALESAKGFDPRRWQAMGRRSQTTPTPNFDSVAGGPLSSTNVNRGEMPLAMSDSATPYVASPMGTTPYTPPPA